MHLCRYIIIFLLSLLSIVMPARATNDDGTLAWMSSTPAQLATSIFSKCLQPPTFESFRSGSVNLFLANPNIWVSAGTQLQEGKTIKFDWSTRIAEGNPRKYLVLYRIDPRFNKPQIFLRSYNYSTNMYESPTFHTIIDNHYTGKTLELVSLLKMSDYVDYFKNSEKIIVAKGDVINITLITNNGFLQDTEDYNGFLNQNTNVVSPSQLYINNDKNKAFENKLIYSSAEKFCDVIDPANATYCSGEGENKKYFSNYIAGDNGKSTLIGRPLSVQQLDALTTTTTVKNCSDDASSLTRSLCFYDQGRGMSIIVNGQIIKNEDTSFLTSKFLNKSLIYYKSDVGGELDFVTNWSIQDMFVKLDKPLMSDWLNSDLTSNINSPDVDLHAKFLHFGQYNMLVEVGNADKVLTTEQQEQIEVEYLIIEDASTPDKSCSGKKVSQEFTDIAGKKGNLWLRVKNPNLDVRGNIIVNYENYTGTTLFSDVVYNKAVKPIKDKFHDLTRIFYSKFADNPSFQRIARIALTLYIIIFGIMFLIGAVQITAQEVLDRIIKIILITTLLSPNSWQFFNEYLFNVFVEGTDYLFTNVIGLTSSNNNVFGFIDPIFDKYTNSQIWGLLFIQLLQFYNGLTLVAMMTIYSLILYFRAILEVIIGYVIAFVGLSVMIGLAPFFIIMILFKQTRGMFDNWLSTLFSYMIQPTILLIFFLLIDQIITEQLLKIVVEACWDPTFIPIKIGLDLNHIGINWIISFSIPFLPGIPFYVPQITDINSMDSLLHSRGTFLIIFTSALLFYSYCLMAYGLVDYVTIVVSQLTNVTPARQEGNPQGNSNPTKSIIDDMGAVAKPISDAALAPARYIKSKLIDQNYNTKPDDEQKEYGGKIFSERNDVEKSESTGKKVGSDNAEKKAESDNGEKKIGSDSGEK